MKTMIVLFNLKPEVNVAEYEQWAKEQDAPTVKTLSAIANFRVHRASGLLGTDAPSPYQYIEVVQIQDMEKLGQEIATEKMQAIQQQFQQFAENPQFILTEQFA
jgi:REDY-like protein HapK